MQLLSTLSLTTTLLGGLVAASNCNYSYNGPRTNVGFTITNADLMGRSCADSIGSFEACMRGYAEPVSSTSIDCNPGTIQGTFNLASMTPPNRLPDCASQNFHGDVSPGCTSD